MISAAGHPADPTGNEREPADARPSTARGSVTVAAWS
jgi:hypothetical protein